MPTYRGAGLVIKKTFSVNKFISFIRTERDFTRSFSSKKLNQTGNQMGSYEMLVYENGWNISLATKYDSSHDRRWVRKENMI